MSKSLDEFYIAGVDETGRGALAGPVIAAAVILNPNHTIKGLKDSKLLTAKKRQELFQEIKKSALAYSIGRADVHEIDKFNIYYATLIAMKKAIQGLSITPTEILVDGRRYKQFKEKTFAIVKGDNLFPAISAASIIAKVTRDEEMILLDEKYPGYYLANNKGYATKKHIEAIKKLGLSEIHRFSFHVF